MFKQHMKVARVNGRYDIHYVDKGSGPAVLLIHGLAGDHKAWNQQITEWSKRYRIIAPDSRGSGRSTQIDEPVAMEDMASDFLQVMTHAEIERFHIVGRSLGGCFAQLMYLQAPRRVASIVMMASAARVSPVTKRCLDNMREILELSGSWAAHARHSVLNFVTPEFFIGQPDKVAFIEGVIGGETRLPACYVRQNHMVQKHNVLDRLHEVRCPVFIMYGGRDPLCGPMAAQEMIDRLPQAEIEFYEKSSHFFFLEEPERFMSSVSKWLERQTAAET